MNSACLSGILLFLAIAAPWHILAGLRNPGAGHPVGNIPTPGNVHGFFYFYFINEQVLRFLGKRYPVDYNKLPFVLYWSLHLVWLFPWSIYLPVVLRRAWTARTRWLTAAARYSVAARSALFRVRTTWLLTIYAAVILLFFSLSTNQEYYTFPVYFPLLLLTAGALASEEGELAGEQVADRSPGGTRPDRYGCRGRAWATACGPHAAFPPAATLAPYWRIGTWPATRSRCLTYSISPGRPLPRCACPRGWPPPAFCWVP